MAFTTSVRRQILDRDRWTCRGAIPELQIPCIGDFLVGKTRSFGDSFMIQASHVFDFHGSQNPKHGRCQCVGCHAIYHYHFGEPHISKLILRTSTIKTYQWIGNNGYDEDIDFTDIVRWYLDMLIVAPA